MVYLLFYSTCNILSSSAFNLWVPNSSFLWLLTADVVVGVVCLFGLQVHDIHLADTCKITPAKFSGSKEVVPLHFRKQVFLAFNSIWESCDQVFFFLISFFHFRWNFICKMGYIVWSYIEMNITCKSNMYFCFLVHMEINSNGNKNFLVREIILTDTHEWSCLKLWMNEVMEYLLICW